MRQRTLKGLYFSRNALRSSCLLLLLLMLLLLWVSPTDPEDEVDPLKQKRI